MARRDVQLGDVVWPLAMGIAHQAREVTSVRPIPHGAADRGFEIHLRRRDRVNANSDAAHGKALDQRQDVLVHSWA